jgi:hypothetical protein
MFDLLKINGQIELETFRKAFKNFNELSARQVKKEPTELIMLFLDYDRPKKVKMIVQREKGENILIAMENKEFLCYEDIQPHDKFIIELIEKSYLKGKNPQDNIIAWSYADHISDIACEFYRMTFDPRLVQRPIQKKSKKDISLVEIEALILNKTWLMLKQIDYLENNERSSEELIVEAFGRLLWEGLLMLPTMFLDSSLGKTKSIEAIEKQNKRLILRNAKDNPFLQKTLCNKLIDVAIPLTNDTQFWKEYYKPMVDARMQLPKHLYNDPSIKLVGKLLKQEHRGRPRKK